MIRSVARVGGLCADAVTSVYGEGQTVTGVQVWGDTAQGAFGGDVLFLRRIDGRWRPAHRNPVINNRTEDHPHCES